MSRPFPLAGLLRLRRLQEEAASAQLARARAAERERQRREQRVRSALGDSAVDATSAEAVQSIAAARASATSMLGELDALLAQDATVTAEAERAHAAAKGRTTQLEKLEERHVRARTTAERKAEQKLLDEHAGRTTARRAGAAGTEGEK